MGSLVMKKGNPHPLFGLVLLLFLVNNRSILTPFVDAKSNVNQQVHIVYMGEKQHADPELTRDSHHTMLASVLGSKEAAVDSILYSYKHGFSGFAAKLTESQAQTIAELPGVVHVIPNRLLKLRTTRSWDYLGLSSHSPTTNLLSKTNMGDGIIIGLLDSGIWPESKVFNDKGLGPIPSQWKGFCESGDKFNPKINCNKKLIGARWFIKGFLAQFLATFGQPFNATAFQEYLSPRDGTGHGTHTSSIAGGSLVGNTSYKGLGRGTVRGGAPRSRLAMYKVCWARQCASADILKAFDEAIHDGVHVLSLSLGFDVPLFSDVDERGGIATGSFHAVAKGITVVCSGGNSGPSTQTIENTAPWILTVAASTIDRAFPTPITLGNNQTIMGEAMFTGKEIGFTGLIFPEIPGLDPTLAGVCENLLLDNTTTVGKVVLCFTSFSSPIPVTIATFAVKDAGGIGLIVAKNPSNAISPCTDDFPCVEVNYEIGTQILYYIRSTRFPKVKLQPSKTLVGKPVSTKLAYFSSRGPSSIAPAVLKPDIAAPGVSILAATTPVDPSMLNGRFAFKSGTSMACPHVAGIVALLKSLYPDWSPASIKSALITTAWTTDPSGSGQPIFAEGDPQKLADPFDFGGGVVNLNKAAYPGLVYDMGMADYTHYLCSVGYRSSVVSQLTQQPKTCQHKRPSILDVNLPSITIPNLINTTTLTRTVTNVGPVNSVYKALINPPFGIIMAVKPDVMIFNSTTKMTSFMVTVTSTHQVNTGYYFGSLTWTDGVHTVRSPISVRTKVTQDYVYDG